ncbi:MAG: tetratricopeptide repeat protein [Bacteroidota bacterium]|nr:tetratricopeptide repeat protein [Bacteroidota bacterium]MDP4232995.1 tetratricopeptide repeat protein [Bacteroidota bacterium]MDP4242039.1 tetratricopeptide repeat protein [Bacteroidota bacterium]MDP4286942.1 tetratricopeptide repeat protein [Bacteroidota bacterium]
MIPLRLARELTYQLARANEQERLANALAQIPLFVALYDSESKFDLLALWAPLSTSGYEPARYYSDALDLVRGQRSSLLPDALKYLHAFFEIRGSYDVALQLAEELLAWSENAHAPRYQYQAHCGIGEIMRRRGDYDLAMSHFAASLKIAEALGEPHRVMNSVGSIGLIHWSQSRYPEAMSYYEKRLALAESIGDKHGASIAIANIGSVHGEQGHYSLALECYGRRLSLAEAMGDMRGMAVTLGNIGMIEVVEGHYSNAKVNLRRSLSIADALGDAQSSAVALGNMGTVLHKEGHFEEALDYHHRYLALEESLGARRGIAAGFGEIGAVYESQGRYDDALRSYRLALEGHSQIRSRYGMTIWLLCIARVLLEQAIENRPDSFPRQLEKGKEELLAEARSSAMEGLASAVDLGMSDVLFTGQLLLARMDATEGKVESVIAKMEGMLGDTVDEEQRAELHYRLWKFEVAGHESEALSRYVLLYSRTPEFEFRQRIAELKGERIPLSADELRD